MALVKNNARVAADIAVELANLLRGGNASTGNGKGTTKDPPKPVSQGMCAMVSVRNKFVPKNRPLFIAMY